MGFVGQEFEQATIGICRCSMMSGFSEAWGQPNSLKLRNYLEVSSGTSAGPSAEPLRAGSLHGSRGPLHAMAAGIQAQCLQGARRKNMTFSWAGCDFHQTLMVRTVTRQFPGSRAGMSRSHCKKGIWNGRYYLGHLWKIQTVPKQSNQIHLL